MTAILPPGDAFLLARYDAGGPSFDLDALQSDTAREIGRAMFSANGAGRHAALDVWLGGRPRDEADAIQHQLLAVDPSGAPPATIDAPLARAINGSDKAPAPAERPPDCPALPESARIVSPRAAAAGVWLDDYTDYALARSPMTPRLFHESAGLVLGSVAIARRLVLRLAFGDIYPNLAIIWIAMTTLYAKSTGLTIARGLARRLFGHLLAPQEMTVEALLSDLAGYEPAHLDKLPETERDAWQQERNFAAQRAVIEDEVSSLFSNAGRDYNAGLIEALLRLYDCDPRYTRSTRSQGRVTVNDAYFTLLGATTPSALAPHLQAEHLWAKGWWARCNLLTPPTTTPTWKTATETPEPATLAATLGALYRNLPTPVWPTPPVPLSVVPGGGVYDAWARYDKVMRYDLLQSGSIAPRLHGTYGRLPAQLWKVAIILSGFDWADAGHTGEPRIEMAHLARAQGIVESWRESAHRALVPVARSAGGSLRSLCDRVLQQLDSRPKDKQPPTLRDFYRGIREHPPAEVIAAVQQLIEVGELEAFEAKLDGPGRPTQRFRRTEEA